MRNKFDELFSFVKREGKDDLLKHLERIGYFTAPASSKFHLADGGGLLEHSVNVATLMINLAPTLKMDVGNNWESIVIAGLFHDIGKASYYGKANYVENILKSGKVSAAKPYEVNKDRLSIPHEVASIHILSQHIELTEDETFAILYHNGLYTPTGYAVKGNETELYCLLHFADLWSSRITEG